jgi:hypothetical protein
MTDNCLKSLDLVNFGLVLKGSLGDIDALREVIKENLRGCQIIFSRVSSDRLWIITEETRDTIKTLDEGNWG